MLNIEKKSIQCAWPDEFMKSAGEEDLFIIDYFRKCGGYLVDIACACPVSGSLSFKLLNNYYWQGLLVEPSPFHTDNIESCYGDIPWIHFFPGAIKQNETFVTLYQPSKEIGLATLIPNELSYRPQPSLGELLTYKVPAKGINELFIEYDVPNKIDFLNLDIEGSENEVLDYLDFERWRVKLICIEDGEKYEGLLRKRNYNKISQNKYKFMHGNTFYELLG